MQSIPRSPRRRTSFVLGLAVVMCLTGIGGLGTPPAAADIESLYVGGPPPNHAGWHKGLVPVSISFSGSERGSGREEQLLSASCSLNGQTVAERPQPEPDGHHQHRVSMSFTVPEGFQYAECIGTYRVRNYSCPAWCTYDPWQFRYDRWQRAFKVDSTPPSVAAVMSREPNAAGWHNEPFTITWTGTDGLSGVNYCAGDQPSDGEIDSAFLSQASGFCMDRADNRGWATVPLKLDFSPPTLAPVIPEGIEVGSVADADPGGFDNKSGVDTESCEPLDTSTAGTFDVTCTATDVAGNTASVTVPYEVLPRRHPVTVALDGDGTVSSTPAGIDCPSECVTTVEEGDDIELSASAAPGSVFVGWAGDCAGTGPCNVTVDGPRTVTATFSVDGDGDGIADTPPPVHKDECKNGGWAAFNNPSFSNQGRCVSYVQSGHTGR